MTSLRGSCGSSRPLPPFPFSSVGFCGSRALAPRARCLVAGVVGRVLARGASVSVGCAAGADAFVRAAAGPRARVFRAESRRPAALVARSVCLVRSLAAAPGSCLVGFVSVPCPAGIAPAPRWHSGRPCSGSWSSLALAAGLGVPVFVFVVGLSSRSALPAWSGGSWRCVGPGPFCGSWSFVPSATQPALL